MWIICNFFFLPLNLMEYKYSVTLQKIIDGNDLGVVYMPGNAGDIYIFSRDVNRPALLLAGRDDYFDPRRLQFLGLSELGYLKGLTAAKRNEALKRLCEGKPVAIIVTRGLRPPEALLAAAAEYGVPVLSSAQATSVCMAQLISYLAVELAERITRHGVLVDVAGEGVLITGESGVGKSETAVELIKRGHRLIADDAVEIRKVSEKTLVGSAPDNIRHFIEIRGVGIINARETFGTAAVKQTQKIDMIIHLEPLNPEKVYDRLGIDDEYVELLGIKIPTYVVPVKPGRNLAVIIEIAAIRFRQKRMGYDAAEDLITRLSMDPAELEPKRRKLDVWH